MNARWTSVIVGMLAAAGIAAPACNCQGPSSTDGGSDAGPGLDAGGGTDAGGSTDAGTNPDSGSVADAGPADAGGTPDAGGTCIAQMGAKLDHTCVLKVDGTVWCWGRNDYGQVGNGTTTNFSTPVNVFSQATAVYVGWYHTCALKNDGTLWCWGRNDSGQFGNGGSTSQTVPTEVYAALTGAAVTSAAPGASHTCAILPNGTAQCTGDNTEGELGNPASGAGSLSWANVDVSQISGSTTFTLLDSGFETTCGVLSGGALYCWGYNSFGQLGTSTNLGTYLARPSARVSFSGVPFVISAGNVHVCAVDDIGEPWCWGKNDYGQLGIGSRDSNPHPSPSQVTIATGTSVQTISAGFVHSCALGTDSNVYCWGANDLGQAGTGTACSPAPCGPTTGTQVAGLSASAVLVVAGGSHSCAATRAGKVWCWGNNAFGEIGNGSSTSVIPAPAQVSITCP